MPWGETAEISAADVRGITLDEMTRRVSAMMKPKYQAKRELKKQEELAKKARKASEATAIPDEEDIPAASEKGNDVLAAVKPNPEAPTSETEAVPTPMKGSAVPEIASIKPAGTSKHDVAERSDRAFDVSATNKPAPDASNHG